jgi:hypothetical protein
MSDFDDRGKEPASEKAKRKWGNADIERRYKEARQNETDEFAVAYGKKQRPTAPPAVKIFTPSDADLETVEQRRTKRIKTATELRRQIRMLEDVVRSGRNGLSEITLAGYCASLETRKRALLLEKLKRLEQRI